MALVETGFYLETNREEPQTLWLEFLLIPKEMVVVDLFPISKERVKFGVFQCLRWKLNHVDLPVAILAGARARFEATGSFQILRSFSVSRYFSRSISPRV